MPGIHIIYEEWLTQWCKRCMLRRAWSPWCYRYSLRQRHCPDLFPQKERRRTTDLWDTLQSTLLSFRCQEAGPELWLHHFCKKNYMLKGGLTIHQGPGAQHKKNQQGKHSEGRAKVYRDNCWSRDSKNNNQNRVNFSKAMICTMQQITVKAKELKQQHTCWVVCWYIQVSSLTCRWKLLNPASLQWRMGWLCHIYISIHHPLVKFRKS